MLVLLVQIGCQYLVNDNAVFNAHDLVHFRVWEKNGLVSSLSICVVRAMFDMYLWW